MILVSSDAENEQVIKEVKMGRKYMKSSVHNETLEERGGKSHMNVFLIDFAKVHGQNKLERQKSIQAVLSKLNLNRCLMNTIKERKIAYLGHTKRNPSMMRNLLGGKRKAKEPMEDLVLSGQTT